MLLTKEAEILLNSWEQLLIRVQSIRKKEIDPDPKLHLDFLYEISDQLVRKIVNCRVDRYYLERYSSVIIQGLRNNEQLLFPFSIFMREIWNEEPTSLLSSLKKRLKLHQIKNGRS